MLIDYQVPPSIRVHHTGRVLDLGPAASDKVLAASTFSTFFQSLFEAYFWLLGQRLTKNAI